MPASTPPQRVNREHQEKSAKNEITPVSDDTPSTYEKDIRAAEAADIFGDVQTAEEYGYVTRG